MDLVPPLLVFDLTSETSYCSIKLKNLSSDPKVFTLKTNNVLEAYMVKPNKGLIAGNGSILLRVKLVESKRNHLLKTKNFAAEDEFLIHFISATKDLKDKYLGETNESIRKGLVEDYLKSWKGGFKSKVFRSEFVFLKQGTESKSTWSRVINSSIETMSSVFLDRAELLFDIRKTPCTGKFTLTNKTGMFMTYSVISTTPERLLIDCAQGLIYPHQLKKINVSLSESFLEKTRLDPTTLPPSEILQISVFPLQDPDLIDVLLSEWGEEPKKFIAPSLESRKPGVWHGTLECKYLPRRSAYTMLQFKKAGTLYFDREEVTSAPGFSISHLSSTNYLSQTQSKRNDNNDILSETIA